MFGNAGPKPNYHDPAPALAASPRPEHIEMYDSVTPPPKRKAHSAHPRAQKSAIDIPTANPYRRPYTSKNRSPRNDGSRHNTTTARSRHVAPVSMSEDSYSSDDNDSLVNFGKNPPGVSQSKRAATASQPRKRPNSSNTDTSLRQNSGQPVTSKNRAAMRQQHEPITGFARNKNVRLATTKNPTSRRQQQQLDTSNDSPRTHSVRPATTKNTTSRRQQQQLDTSNDSPRTNSVRPATTKNLIGKRQQQQLDTSNDSPRTNTVRPHTTKNPSSKQQQRQQVHSDSPRGNYNHRPATTKSTSRSQKLNSAYGGTRQNSGQLDSWRTEDTEPERESRPLTSKERLMGGSTGGRNNAKQERTPPNRPMVQQWMKPRPKQKRKPTKSRYNSEYSRAALNKHFAKHEKIRKSILHKSRPKKTKEPPQKPPTPDQSSESDLIQEETDSTEILSGSGDEEGEEYVPSPTPTPEPIKEIEKLDMNDEDLEAPPTPVMMSTVEYPKVEINYTPPSHVLKIVDDAREFSESDWSEDEPVYVLKDGKRGTFIKSKDDKYLLAKTVKEKERRKRQKLNKRLNKEKRGEDLIKEIHYINYEADEEEEEDGEEEVQVQRLDENGDAIISTPSKAPQYNDSSQNVTIETESESETETETESELEMESESEYDSEGRKIEKLPKPPKRRKPPRKKRAAVFIHYKSSDEESKKEDPAAITKEEEEVTPGDQNDEQEAPQKVSIRDMIQVGTSEEEEENEDEDEQKSKVPDVEDEEEEELANLRPETVADDRFFDSKKDQDSDSDLDEFGRVKGRQRPSSAMFDFLPPLKPDPRLDGGDITNCKNRLSRHVVIIREALARNEQDDLETAIDVIIANNSDNRRWLRKIYRDSYLQSLLLDLRKTLPADVASVISYMMIPICEFDAMCLWDALKGLHKDPEVLCEILCTRTNKEMEQIRIAYALRYDVELIDHIEDETISAFQRMLMKLASGQREEVKDWTKADAARETTAIIALLETRGEHCTKKLIEVFCQLPIEMLRAVINEYKKMKGTELDEELIKRLKGNFQRCIITIIHYIQNPPNYFVEKLHATHYGNVDDDKGLCRLIISRSEPEVLEMIKQLFVLRYDMTLYDYVEQTCKGPLKGLVLRIVAGQLTDEERSEYAFPPLWPGREDPFTMKRLTFDQLITTLLRRSKVADKMERVLIAYQEQEDDSSDEVDDSGSEAGTEAVAEEQEADEELNSEEEEEAAEQAAAAELQKGLKNISFAEDIPAPEEEGVAPHTSVFKDISFAKASRGILKNVEVLNALTVEEGDEEEEEEEGDGGDSLKVPEAATAGVGAGGEVSSRQLTQLNGPVHDPTFTGRNQQSVRIPFMKAKKKGPNLRATVQGVDMENFNALKDAQAIGKALLQKKRNIEGVLQFMTTRNNAQRQLIIREFFRRYRRDLVDDIRTLGPRLEEMALALLLGNEIFASASLYANIKGENSLKCVDSFIEILCSRQNDEIVMLKKAFNGVFGLSLIDEVSKMTSGYTQHFFCAILEGQREEVEAVDEQRARMDAQALYEAVIMRPPETRVFIDIFATRNFPHIAKVCEEFALLRKTDILEIIHKVIQGAFKAAIIATVCVARDIPMFFCERIYKSMAYRPMDYEMLVRVIISRSEIDLVVIKALFRRTYGRTIYSMIEKDTDYHAKKILLDVVKK